MCPNELIILNCCLEFLAWNDVIKMHAQLAIMFNIDVLPHFQTKFDVKITKMEWNHTVNLNMNAIVIVCQHVHYFTGKLLLAFQSAIASSQSMLNMLTQSIFAVNKFSPVIGNWGGGLSI